MKHLSILFVMTLSLAAFGCKKKGGDCAAAIDHGMELSKADMGKLPAADLAKLRDIGLQHCKDDKWSDEALKCMIETKTEADARACYGKLTADQRDKMNKAAMAVMSPPAPAAGSAEPAGGGSAMGSAAMGSDTGAAGSATAGSGNAAAPK